MEQAPSPSITQTPTSSRLLKRASQMASLSSLGRSRVLVFPFVALLADLGLRTASRGNTSPTRWSSQDFAVYGLGIAWSFATWLLVSDLLNRLGTRRPKFRKVLVGLLSAGCGFAFMASFAYRSHFDQSPSWQVVKWSIAEWMSVFQIARWVVGFREVSAVVLTALLCAVSLGKAELPFVIPRFPKAIVWLLGVVAYGVVTTLSLGVAGFQDPLPVDTNAVAAISQLVMASATHTMHLVTPVRPAIAKQPEKKRPNVLLLVQESLRADAVFPDLGYLSSLKTREIAPFGSTIPSRKEEGYFAFVKARTNSTATESSVPSIISGVDPGGQTEGYGRATSVWAIGKATGAKTFLFSAQSYSFSHFDEYFFDANLDIEKTGEDLSKVLVNDRGIDDGIAVDAALEHLKILAKDKQHFVGAIHFNGTHSPGWPGPDVALVHQERDNSHQYSQAARYIDKQLERVMKALIELGLDDTTVVIASSDHGEAIVPHHPVDRLGSFYEETTRIPIWVKIPPGLLLEHPEWRERLEAWRSRNVQNLDVLPTIRDVLQIEDDPKSAVVNLPGRSLITMPSGDDIMMGQSTCGFRQWALDGFYLVNGTIKVIVSNDQATPQVYDLVADPLEEHNLWGEAEWKTRVMPWLQAAVKAGEERMAACKRVREVCPVVN